MTTKLPAYFEKYFEQKFSAISDQISELKTHVNDEIFDFKRQVKLYLRWTIIIGVMTTVLILLHIDQFGPIFLSSLRKFIGL